MLLRKLKSDAGSLHFWVCTSCKLRFLVTVDGGRNVLRSEKHTDEVHGVAWSSSEGSHIAAASFDHTVQVWNAFTGEQVLVYRGRIDHRVNTVAWSKDCKFIVSGDDHAIALVWSVG